MGCVAMSTSILPNDILPKGRGCFGPLPTMAANRPNILLQRIQTFYKNLYIPHMLQIPASNNILNRRCIRSTPVRYYRCFILVQRSLFYEWQSWLCRHSREFHTRWELSYLMIEGKGEISLRHVWLDGTVGAEVSFGFPHVTNIWITYI